MAGKKRSVRLRSISDANRFLAKVINMLNRDEIDSSKAGRLGYLINILIGSFRDADLEKRISVLEEKFKSHNLTKE